MYCSSPTETHSQAARRPELSGQPIFYMSRRPHVLFILSDQLNLWSLSAYVSQHERVRATVSIEMALVNRMPKKDVVRRFLCNETGEPAPEGVKRRMCMELTCRGAVPLASLSVCPTTSTSRHQHK